MLITLALHKNYFLQKKSIPVSTFDVLWSRERYTLKAELL